MLGRKISRVLEVYRTEGVQGVRSRLQYVRRSVFWRRSYYLLVLDIGTDGPAFPPDVEKLLGRLRKRFPVERVDSALLDDLDAYVAQRGDLTAEEVRNWLGRGHCTMMIRHKGRTVGDCWVALDDYPFPTRSLRLKSLLESRRWAYSYMAKVEPGYRGFGLFPLILAEQAAYARDAGLEGLVGAALPRSQDSRGSMEKLDFRPLGVLTIFRVLGREYSLVRMSEGARR